MMRNLKKSVYLICLAVMVFCAGAVMAVNRTEALRGCFGTYAGAPQKNGRVDQQALLADLLDIRANTYYWLFRPNTNALEDLKTFLPLAQKQNIKVWITLVPPSETFRNGRKPPDALKADYEHWILEFARLSAIHTNFVAWGIDDFPYNLEFWTPADIKRITDAVHEINPRFAFVPCCYFRQITPAFATNYGPYCDGIHFPYHDGSGGRNLQNTGHVKTEIATLRRRVGFSLPIILSIYASPHSRLGATTPQYVEDVMAQGKMSADGILIYCHQDKVKNPAKYGIIKKLFTKWASDGWVLRSPKANSAQAALEFPGPFPGQAIALASGGALLLSNQTLSVQWAFGAQRLGSVMARNERTGESLALPGEVFTIVLADGCRYPASALVPSGKPRVRTLAAEPAAARLAARTRGRQIALPLRTADGRLAVTWRALLHDGANYVRQELEVKAAGAECAVQEIAWCNATVPGAKAAGAVDGSPVLAGDFFLGYEDPMASNAVTGTHQLACRLLRNTSLNRGETLTQSFMLGVAPQGQMRRAFLYYLERERAHPYRPYLHYNSYYDLAGSPFTLNETNCLETIELWGKRFIRPFGVTMDGMVFDDGWDNWQTLWQFHGGFPNGFAPLAARCRQYHSHLGVWLSPFGGYGRSKEQRLQFGREQGYEINDAGFSLAGAKYCAAFKGACVGMIRKYGVNHFKFDGLAAGSLASGAAQYLADTEAMRRLMLELRQEDPNLYINLTTGSWPSPFWLRYADSLWRQGNDMGRAGKGSSQQQWLTYRDQEVYRNIVRRSPLFPLNALMTQGVAYSRRGKAGDPAFNSAGFKDDVWAFFGSGTSLQELYIQPGRLSAQDWQVLAEAANWSRTNATVLMDTHWIGGDPSKLEVGGYASWSPRKGIVSLRNPDDQPHEYALDIESAFELPPGAPRRYQLKSPWAEAAARPALTVEAGEPVTLTVQPFEVLILEATP